MLEIRKAERKKSKLRLGLCGVAGSGKTIGAINVAAGMGARFVIIDTENQSADLYSHIAEYDVLTLDSPFSPQRYIDAINVCEKSGYDLIIIDSLSHAWAGTGGILDIHTAKTNASSTKNSFSSWRTVTPIHNSLIDKILKSNCHIIATMRLKTAYEIIENDRGKKEPVKIGMSPIQKEGLDYEFTTVLDIDKSSHLYTSSKDRTQLFEGKNGFVDEHVGKQLIDWLNEGSEIDSIKGAQKVDIENYVDQKKLIDDSILIDISCWFRDCKTLEELKKDYISSIKKYPSLKEKITELKDKRKLEIEEYME